MSKKIRESVKTKNINIAFITDKDYAVPTYITIFSMKQSKLKTSIYNIYVIHTGVKQRVLDNLLKLHSEDFKINIIKVNDDFKDLQFNIHVSTAAIIKFKLDSILSKLKKVLYLDGDLIIQQDLSKLYNTDISDKYAGVVKDIAPMLLYHPSQNERLGINHRHYFNSGVMLLNLEKIRSDNIQKDLINYRKNGRNFFMDQDALNVCFKDNVEFLDVKNNFLVTLLDRFSIQDICKYYNTSITKSFSNSVILHFSSKFKPWKYYDVSYFNIWNKIYEATPYKGYYNRTYKNEKQIIVSLTSYPARIGTVNQTIETLLNQTKKADKIVLYLGKDKFPNQEKDLPKKLQKLCSDKFEIHWVKKDLRSFTKLIPALKEYPNSIIITVDDDILYPSEMLERLLISYNKKPEFIHCHRAHRMLLEGNHLKPYNQWQLSYKNSSVSYNNFLTGVGGVLYPPHCLYNDVFDEEKFMRLCPMADDVWFWAMAVLNNTPIKIVENNITKLAYVDGTQEVALWRTNVAESGNDPQIQNVIAEYPKVLKKIIKENIKENIRKHLKSYLLFPYYLLATMWMKWIYIPILKFIKHMRAIWYSHSHRGKMDMLNNNFRQLLKTVQVMQSQLNKKIDNLDSKYSKSSSDMETKLRQVVDIVNQINPPKKSSRRKKRT